MILDQLRENQQRQQFDHEHHRANHRFVGARHGVQAFASLHHGRESIDGTSIVLNRRLDFTQREARSDRIEHLDHEVARELSEDHQDVGVELLAAGGALVCLA